MPETLAGESVLVKLYSEKMIILNKEHKVVARHIRNYGTNEWVVDINHFISTLMKKTSTIQYSEAFHQIPLSMKVIYHDHFKVALQTMRAKDEPFREDQKTSLVNLKV